jgi:hypothetical protein
MAETAKQPASTVESGSTNMPNKPPGDVRRRAPKKQAKGPFVKYVGDASHRIIRPPQWRSLGIDVKDDTTHVWSVQNDKLIPSEQFSDEQLDYLLIDDMQPKGGHAFIEVDYDEDGNLKQVTS